MTPTDLFRAAFHRVRPGGVTLAAVVLVAACSSSPQTRYYAVESAVAVGGNGAARIAYGGPPLEVRSFQIPPAMDRLEMIRQLPESEIRIYEFDHWAAPLGRLARQALAEDLASRLPEDKLIFPGAAGPDARAVLTVDVLSFQVRGGKATMIASWSVKWPSQPSPNAQAGAMPATSAARSSGKTSVALDSDVAAGNGASDIARAWSALVAQLSDRIAADLVR